MAINTNDMQTKNGNLADRIINGFKEGIAEIETLRVQIALGKAEAKDLYEEAKKKFKKEIDDAKTEFNKIAKGSELIKIINAFEMLQVQLSLGVAETAVLFETQKRAIIKAIEEFEVEMRQSDLSRDYAELIHFRFEKFKIELELLSLHYQLKKLSTQFDFEQKKTELLNKVESLKKSMSTGKDKVMHGIDVFGDELSEAYSHFKKAFKG